MPGVNFPVISRREVI